MKKAILIKFVFVSIVLCGIFSCNKKNEDPVPDPNPTNATNGNNLSAGAFLKEGMEYTFIYSEFSTADTFLMKVEKQLAQDTFLVRNYSDVNYMYPTQYYVLKDGALSVSFRLRDRNSYKTVCKFNQPVGTSWFVTENGYNYIYTIDSVNATVLTGKGKVTDAVKVKMANASSPTEASYVYYSPTVGVLGTGSFGSGAHMQLKDYHTTGSLNSANIFLPAITYGSFPFTKVGNYWRCNIETFTETDVLRMDILSKSAQGIYTVKMTYESDNSEGYEYWYEDNGLLMAFEEGENHLQADPIYMSESMAKAGYGWTGSTSSGTIFHYRVSKFNSNKSSTSFGALPCMEISVYTGSFGSQTNYWNKDKGQIGISGFAFTMDVIASNAKLSTKKHSYIPGFTY